MQECRRTNNNQLTRSWRSLALFLTISFAVASLSCLIMNSNLSDWYASLETPSFMPPFWTFGAAWSFLYSSMAFALWRVWLQRHRINIRPAVVLYHTQLVLNLLWTIIFFGFHNPGLAFIEITILQLATISTAYSFSKISKLSSYLFVPHVLWISLASILNFYIWIANY